MLQLECGGPLMPHSRCAVHHMLVRLLPLRLTQAFHLEHLHRSESQLFGIELQLRSHLNGQRRGASAALAAASSGWMPRGGAAAS